MSTTLHLNITAGPSIHTLIDAFRYAFDRETPHKAIFSLRETTESHLNDGSEKRPTDLSWKVTITALEHEDASGSSIVFKGKMGILPYESRYSTQYDVTGWYNTRTQKGYIIAES